MLLRRRPDDQDYSMLFLRTVVFSPDKIRCASVPVEKQAMVMLDGLESSNVAIIKYAPVGSA